MNKSIPLSKRMAVAALALSLGITILIVVVFLITSSRGLLEMEESIADEASARAIAVLNSKTEGLVALTEDYALWDDMLLYLQGRDPSFLSRTFSDASLENLDLNFVALYGVQGKLLWSWITPGAPSLLPPKTLEASSTPFSPVQETIPGIMAV
jgi:sensor domain CHASE-containing protein